MHPYSLDNSIRRWVYITIAIISLSIPQYFEELQVLFGIAKPVGITISFGAIFGIIYFLFDNFIWKLLIYTKTVISLDGKWNVKGISSYKDENGKNFTFDMYVIIKQTFTKIEIYTETESSTSKSNMASIELNHAQPIFQYTFENIPKNMANDELQRHPGLMKLRIESNTAMSGDYFSGKHRLRYGELTFNKVTR